MSLERVLEFVRSGLAEVSRLHRMSISELVREYGRVDYYRSLCTKAVKEVLEGERNDMGLQEALECLAKFSRYVRTLEVVYVIKVLRKPLDEALEEIPICRLVNTIPFPRDSLWASITYGIIDCGDRGMYVAKERGEILEIARADMNLWLIWTLPKPDLEDCCRRMPTLMTRVLKRITLDVLEKALIEHEKTHMRKYLGIYIECLRNFSEDAKYVFYDELEPLLNEIRVYLESDLERNEPEEICNYLFGKILSTLAKKVVCQCNTEEGIVCTIENLRPRFVEVWRCASSIRDSSRSLHEKIYTCMSNDIRINYEEIAKIFNEMLKQYGIECR